MCGSWEFGGICQLERVMRDPSPTWGFPSESTSAKKRSPHNIWLWKSVISSLWVRLKGCWKPRCPLKRLMHRLTHWQALTLGYGEGMAGWEVRETHREKLSCVASGERVGGQPSLSWLSPPPTQLTMKCHLSWVESSPHSQIWTFISMVNSTCSSVMTLWYPTPPNSHTTQHQRLFQQQEAALAWATVFLKKLSKFLRPQAHGSWPQCALCVLLNGHRFSTDAESDL